MFKVTEAKVLPIDKPYSGRGIKKSRIYCWPEGESVIENLINRRSRPLKEFRKVAIDGLKTIGANPDSLTLKWSQKAGCPCGCSPGFIVDGWDSAISRNDLHVTFTGEDQK